MIVRPTEIVNNNADSASALVDQPDNEGYVSSDLFDCLCMSLSYLLTMICSSSMLGLCLFASVKYVMFYVGIKSLIKVLIFPTIQKPYFRHFDSLTMAGFADALRPEKFSGVHFKRWQTKATLWLTSMNVFWVSAGTP